MNSPPDDTHQRGKSAVFEARETTATTYNGVNRRREQRRSIEDRRLEMRFQMDRRVVAGRRDDDKQPQFY